MSNNEFIVNGVRHEDVLPYLIFKANYRLLNSEINTHFAYDEFKSFQELARNTVFCEDKILTSKADDKNLTLVEQTIFCSFHLGPYRVLLDFLLSNKFKIVLLISNGAFQSQSEEMYDLLNLRNQSNNINNELIILNIHEKSTFFRLKDYIKKGFSIMTYLDANTDLQNETSSIIEFLGHQIFVNNGILKLSKLFNISITPIFSIWVENKIQICVEPQIQLLERTNDYLTKITQVLFSLLHTKILKTPNQWEGWAYLDEWFVDQAESNNKVQSLISLIQFNTYNYDIVSISDVPFLYDLNNQRFYKLNSDEFELLTLLSSPNINFNKLFEKQILISEAITG